MSSEAANAAAAAKVANKYGKEAAGVNAFKYNKNGSGLLSKLGIKSEEEEEETVGKGLMKAISENGNGNSGLFAGLTNKIQKGAYNISGAVKDLFGDKSTSGQTVSSEPGVAAQPGAVAQPTTTTGGRRRRRRGSNKKRRTANKKRTNRNKKRTNRNKKRTSRK